MPKKKKPMISIVDDDHAVRNATKALIRSLGYRASAFSSAEEFLGSNELQETSCLIADVYGFNWSDFDDRYYNNDNRRRDDYDYRRRNNNNRRNYFQ